MATITDTTNTSFQLAADFINFTGASVFLTGKAGTGKTTFLKHIKENGVKNTVIVAPTGVAAINAGGTTIHSFFQLPFSPFIPVGKPFGSSDPVNDKHSLISQQRLTNDRKEVMQKMELLIIDEISMVRCDVLDAIDTVLRHVRGRHAIPFGGVQVLLIGDLYQLPPVIKPEEWDILSSYYKSEFFFSCHVIATQPPVYVELNKIYRQNDGAFVEVLNQVRNNNMDAAGYHMLHTRYLPDFNPGKEQKYITLTTHNNKADAINFKAINELEGAVYNFDATIEGEFYEKSYPAEINLKLKIGTQVMFVKNDNEKVRRYFNGKIGVVDKIDSDKIYVVCEGEAAPIEVRKEKWKNIRYSLNKNSNQVDESEIGSFTQFPLRLAWAVTIHKSQGLTFEKAIIDAGEAFAPGQVYVALSRCTTLEGMVLHSRINATSLRSDKRIADFSGTQQTSAEQLQLLYKAKHSFQELSLSSLFDFADIKLSAKSLLIFITAHKDVFNAAAVNWAEMVHDHLATIDSFAAKFLPRLKALIDHPELPEQNSALQNRISEAGKYFYNELDNCKRLLDKADVVTDSKTVAIGGDKLLSVLYQNICERAYSFSGCTNGFFINEYLLKKRVYVKPYFSVNLYAGKSSYKKNDSPYPDLYAKLRDKRDEICEQKKLPVYMVASTASLDEMARYLPQTFEELNKITGFGKVRTEKLGEAFLSIINTYCEQHNLHTNMELIPPKAKRAEKNTAEKQDTKMITYQLFKEGKTITEIAAERNYVVNTIQGHLVHFVNVGEIEISKLVSEANQQAIQAAIAEHGSENHKLILEHVPKDIGYGEIKLVLANLKRLASFL